MHRFRKRSDVKRSPVPDSVRTPSELSYHSQAFSEDLISPGLPGLPPESDFRTSLILPDLSRRFSLLRSSSGIPLSLDELRSRIAEQRARGAENQLTEEQEIMILETLRLRMKHGSSSIRDGNSSADSMAESSVDIGDGRQSIRSTTTTTSSSLQYSPTSSRSSGRPSKRYSNNIFGSSRLRDYGYLRSVSSQRSVGSSRSAFSAAPTDMSGRGDGHGSMYSDSLRPTTPENRGTVSVSTSVTSSPNDKTPLARPAQLSPATPMDESPISSQRSENRPSRAFTQAELVNMSIALEDVIREMEEEAEDEIVMPRTNTSAASERGAELSKPFERARNLSYSSTEPHTTATAVSSDKAVLPLDIEARRGSPVPPSRPGAISPRIPGYIPGMPRPMTPRDTAMDSDDQRSHSTTPRAMSPLQPAFSERPSPSMPSNFATGIVRRDSNASTTGRPPRVTSPLGGTPLFTSRSVNGRFTPEGKIKNGEDLFGENSTTSDAPRRPVSPFFGNAYQRNGPSSRPGTPSNIRWNTSTSPVSPKTNGRTGSVSGHSKSESIMSNTDTGTDIHGSLERSKSTTRSLRSPALPDSPLIDNGAAGIMSRFDGRSSSDNNRPPSSISGQLGSPILIATRPLRSPTPTQSATRSAAFSDSDASYTNGNGDARSIGRSPPASPFSPNRLLFSPIANSSRSSLESAGSSYHSWDEEGKRDRVYGLFKDLDPEQPVWHQLVSDNTNSTVDGSYADDDWDPEDIIRRYAGLTKGDFTAIQDRLVKAAVYKTATPESRPPSLRRRRPSTSHSVHAAENRATSPVLQGPVSAPSASSPGSASNPDSYAKANALLNSVIDSIQSPRSKAAELDAVDGSKRGLGEESSPSHEPSSPSSPRRRRKDLDDVLFGSTDSDRLLSAPALASTRQDIDPEPYSPISSGAIPEAVLHDSPSSPTAVDSPPLLSAVESHTVTTPSTPKSPLLVDPAELARDVQRRAEEATAALRKIPSNSKLRESRRRINPNQISSPHLVLASTSVDTIPLRTVSPTVSQAQSANNSKIGQRIRKIRGTFRHRPPALNGEEITPFPLDLRPNQTSSPTRDDQPLDQQVPTLQPSMSTVESSNDKFAMASPPASAPGFRGLISRWRKPRNTDLAPEPDRLGSTISPSAAASSVTLSPGDRNLHGQAHSAPAYSTKFPLKSPTDTHQLTSNVSSSPLVESITERPSPSASAASSSSQAGDNALKQFLDAATNLGIAPEDISDLLVRSSSTSSRPLGSRLMRNTSNSQTTRSQNTSARDRARSPTQSDGRPSLDSYFARPPGNVVRKLSLRSRAEAKDSENGHSRREAEDSVPVNAIVRRTIIMPSDSRVSTFDLSLLTRKNSKRRRPTSATSAQSKTSVHDRAPTPPPPKAAAGRRFSNEASPPVPQIPSAVSTAGIDGTLQVPPARPLEKSSSNYESLYEMYAGEGKPPVIHTTAPPEGDSSSAPNSGRPSTSEPPPAIEVVEMANGETIWSIVNGLRDDDGESIYANRASFLSEYSLHDTSQDGMQVFFKEHARKSSKGSNTSYISHKKPTLAQNRPETKVFYSSPAQIGRLIENLSHNMDAGSFNFASRGPDEAEMNWTVEERLEQMLGSMGHSS